MNPVADNAPHPASLPGDRLLQDCDLRFTRRSGPGGQNRNKVESAAILTHRPTGISAEANERRSQAENRTVATKRLRLNLALKIRRPVDAAAGPSALWRSRIQGHWIIVSRDHQDYPAMLAEALDWLEATGGDVKAAAEALGCSVSQLVKFLKTEPMAIKRVNDRRRELGKRPMH